MDLSGQVFCFSSIKLDFMRTVKVTCPPRVNRLPSANFGFSEAPPAQQKIAIESQSTRTMRSEAIEDGIVQGVCFDFFVESSFDLATSLWAISERCDSAHPPRQRIRACPRETPGVFYSLEAALSASS